jgi:hypothetical protein
MSECANQETEEEVPERSTPNAEGYTCCISGGSTHRMPVPVGSVVPLVGASLLVLIEGCVAIRVLAEGEVEIGAERVVEIGDAEDRTSE